MATKQDYNHIHPKSEESYGPLQAKGGDKHLTANHERGSKPGHYTGGPGIDGKMD